MIATKSKQGARARINTEQMIRFDGMDQYAVSDGVNDNIISAINFGKAFSFSFILQLDSVVSGAGRSSIAYFLGPYQRYFYNESIKKSYFNGIGFAVQSNTNGMYSLLVLMRNGDGNNSIDRRTNFDLVYGRKYAVVVTYDPVSKMKIFIQSRETAYRYRLDTAPSAQDIWAQGSYPIAFGVCINLDQQHNYRSNCRLAHVAVYDRLINLQEMEYLRITGGLIPKSLHAHVAAHYPCNQVSGDILLDATAQYQYARLGQSPLTPFHARLINFDATKYSGPLQTAYQDFYHGDRALPYLQHFNGTDQYALAVVNPNVTGSGKVDWNTAFSLVLGFALYAPQAEIDAGTDIPLLNTLYEYQAGKYRGLYLHYHQGRLCLEIFTNLEAEAANIRKVAHCFSFSPQRGRVYQLILMKNGIANCMALINGKIYPAIQQENPGQPPGANELAHDGNHWLEVGRINNAVLNAATYAACAIGEIIFLDKCLQQAEAINLFDQRGLPASLYQHLLCYYQANELAEELSDITAQYNTALTIPYPLLLQGFSGLQHRGLIEKSSGMPAIKNALKLPELSTSLNQYAHFTDFAPGKEAGYTMLFTFCLEADRDFESTGKDCLISKRGVGEERILFRLIKIGTTNFLRLDLNGSQHQVDINAFRPFNRIHQAFACIALKNKDNPTNGYFVRFYLDGQLLASFEESGFLAGFDDFSGNTRIGSDELAGSMPGAYLLQTGIARGVLSLEQVTRLWNNGLLSQPGQHWSANELKEIDWQMYLDCNQALDQAGAYYLQNFGSFPADALLSGFTANEISQQFIPIHQFR
jgi:hypothetical protein